MSDFSDKKCEIGCDIGCIKCGCGQCGSAGHHHLRWEVRDNPSLVG